MWSWGGTGAELLPHIECRGFPHEQLHQEDEEFKKKPELSLLLIDRSLARGYRPGIILIDAGYGNNTSFLKELEKRSLKYLGGLAKNRKVIINIKSDIESEIRLDELAKSLSKEEFEQVTLKSENSKTVWVATFSARVSRLEGERTFAIIMNKDSFSLIDGH